MHSSTRLPIVCVGVLALFASTLSQAGCSDDETTTTTTTNPTTTSTTSTSTGMGGIGAQGGNGGGGNGGGGMMNTGTDTCDGDLITLDVGGTATRFGDTSMANDDYSSPCEDDGSGPDVVYQLEVANAGTLAINLGPGGNTDVTMYLRTVCDNELTNRWCRNAADIALAREFLTHIPAGTYHLIIDTNGPTGGPFALDLALTAADCGDGATNPGEQCDDGANDADDGCDPNCMFEDASNDDCSNPVAPADIPAGTTTFDGTTLTNNDNHSFNEAACGVTDSGGKDRVYALKPAVSGTMQLRLGWDETNMDPSICAVNIDDLGCWDRVLSVRHQDGVAGEPACASQDNQIACANNGVDPTYVQDISFAVVANETYYVFIDSFWDGGGTPTFAAGPYWLHVNLTP